MFYKSELVDNYSRYSNQDWREWLEFKRTFKKSSGKQGWVGVMEKKGYHSNPLVFFKISKNINYVIYHEWNVMKTLMTLAPYCPNFCQPIGIVRIKSDIRLLREPFNPLDPFNSPERHNKLIERDVLLLDYLGEDNQTLHDFLKKKSTCESQVISLIKQVILALKIAQSKKFSHYDLHSKNIIVKRCSVDKVFLYRLDKDNLVIVPTLGVYPVIIDFGFSYIENPEDRTFWSSLAHTDVGFTPCRYDSITDVKLFLVSVSNEMKIYGSKTSRCLRTIVRNLFSELKLDWKSGWEKSNSVGVADKVMEILNKKRNSSSLFTNKPGDCIDILQTLIILPLEKQDYKSIKVYYEVFTHEFSFIEKQLGIPNQRLWVLKSLVDSARTHRSAYMDESTRHSAVSHFKNDIFESVKQIASFFIPKKLNFEKMLCSLYCLSRSIEGLMYDLMAPELRKRRDAYMNLPVIDVIEIYNIIDVNIQSPYSFSSKTVINLLDCIEKNTKRKTLVPSDLDSINKARRLNVHAEFIYKLYF